MLTGRCTDIGIKGMKLELLQKVRPDDCGVVCLHYQNQAFRLRARVARRGSLHCGLEFVCDSVVEESMIAHLLAKLTAPRSRHPISLVSRVDVSTSESLPYRSRWPT